MGLANMPFGFYGAAVLITVPQLLAARGVPQPTIAAITATAMIPTFCGFLLAPILDVHFNRRSYAIFFGLLTAALAVLALVSIGHIGRFTALLVGGFLAANLFYNALGGWLGDIVGKGAEGKLGASFTIGNVGGFGAGAISFITLMRWLPNPFGAVAVGGLIAAPVLLCLFIPPSPTLRRGVKESFTALFRDIGQLIRKPVVLRTLLMFGLPAASFCIDQFARRPRRTLRGLGTVCRRYGRHGGNRCRHPFVHDGSAHPETGFATAALPCGRQHRCAFHPVADPLAEDACCLRARTHR